MPVEIDGAVELRRALEKFTPDLDRAMKLRIHKALQPVVMDARSYVPGSAPLSKWQAYSSERRGSFPFFNAGEIKAGIDYTTEPSRPNKKGFSYGSTIYNATAGGAIYETAGRKNRNGRKRNPYLAQRAALKQMGVDSEMVAKKMRDRKYSNSNNPNAGKQFINSMPALVNADPRLKVSGKAGSGYKGRGKGSRMHKGRLIYKAWAKDGGNAYNEVNLAVDDAIKKFREQTKGFNFATKQRAA